MCIRDREDIIEQIDNEEYRPGEAIASEKVLMEKYGVSRTTCLLYTSRCV